MTTDNTQKVNIEKLKNDFNKSLNSHGYAFQHAVIHKAKTLSDCGKSQWCFEASEFPVSANGKDTRIDFILQSKDHDQKYCIVAECKRVNPAYSHWCFVKSRNVCGYRSDNRFNMESIVRFDHKEPLRVQTHGEVISDDFCYNIGIAVRSNLKGDSTGKSDNDAIEKSASQVCLGMNGLIELGVNAKDVVLFQKTFIPVIFTTASLWGSNVDLSNTNISDGKIDLSKSSFEEKPWVLFQYHLTPGIKHSIESRQSSRQLSAILDFNYIRTIPVVNANYVGDFLSWLRPQDYF